MEALDAREARIREERASGNTWRAARGKPLLPDLEGAAYADHLKPITILAMHTGMRRGEILQLTWEAINWGTMVLTVSAHTAKSAKTRHIAMNRTVQEMLKAWQPDASKRVGVVWPGPSGKPMTSLKTAWLRLMKAARIENFRFHDLRHDFASQLVMAGTDLYVVRDLLGHASVTMTERYAHLAPKAMADAVSRLG